MTDSVESPPVSIDTGVSGGYDEMLLSGQMPAVQPGPAVAAMEAPRSDPFDRKIVAIRGTPVSLSDMLRGIGTLKASDLFLKVGSPVRFKVSGRVVTFDSQRITRDMMEHVLSCFLSDEDRRQFWQRQSADLVHVTDTARYRVHFAQAQSGVYGAIRVIGNEARAFSTLGMPEVVANALRQLKDGLMLVCGTTDSGKTVTCTSLLDLYNQERDIGILTLEDPTEYVLKEGRSMIVQREVGVHVPSFYEGVKSALRENVDVIFVGEIRDRETIEQVLKAAETGHLVVTTLHAEDCLAALNRIIGTFPVDDQPRIRQSLAATLAGVLFQKLLPGEQGRVLCVESLWANTAVRAIVRAGDLTKLTSYLGKATGGVSYREGLQDLLRRRVISRDTFDAEINRTQA